MWKQWLTGELVRAADFQSYVQDQTVLTFDDATARDAVLTSPVDGMHCYLRDSETLWYYNGAGWRRIRPGVDSGAAIITGSVTVTGTDDQGATYLSGSYQLLPAVPYPTVVMVDAFYGFTFTGDGLENTGVLKTAPDASTWTSVEPRYRFTGGVGTGARHVTGSMPHRIHLSAAQPLHLRLYAYKDSGATSIAQPYRCGIRWSRSASA